ncbi:MAG TPA: cytochrome c [Vicinamibacterales bacterium]|jgi:mono/diheme cytochrome c family protein
MTFKWAAASLIIAQALVVVSAQGKSTQDGVYTAEQAKRGEAIFTRACASCHQPDLSGDGQTPALVGKDFDMDWIDTTIGDLYDRTKISMPADKPGSLSPAEVADVLSFILSKGGFAAGQTELPSDPATLKTIKYVVAK